MTFYAEGVTLAAALAAAMLGLGANCQVKDVAFAVEQLRVDGGSDPLVLAPV